MAQVTPVTALPADGVTTGAVQITGTGLRISARSADDSAQLSLIRMNPVSGKWWRVTETTDPGSAIVIPVKAYGDAQYKWSTDVNLSLDATSTNEYYHLLDNNGGTFSGYAEIESLSALAVGGTVPSARAIATANGILIDGGTGADLSADRTLSLGSVTFTKEANYFVKVGASTTAATVGGNLAVAGGAGSTTGAGGTASLTAGAGGNDAVGGAASVVGGAAGGGNRAGGAVSVMGGAGAGTAAGGAASVAGGVGGATGAGGAASFAGGAAGGAAAAGGAVTIVGGLGNTTGAGGALSATGGAGGNDAVGGAVTVTGGAAGGGNRAGGAATVRGGAGAGTAAGGAVASIGGAGGATGAGGAAAVTGGAGGATSGTGGAVAIAGGAGTNGNADGGAVTIDGGAKNGAGADGTINIGTSAGAITLGKSSTIVTFQSKQAAGAATNTIADPGTGAAIPVTANGVVPIVTAAAETNTLAIPTFMGQELILTMDTRVGGDRVVTASQAINQAGNTIMTFGAARDTICLRGITVGGALRWQVAWNEGVALS